MTESVARAWRIHQLGSPAEALRLDRVARRAPDVGEVRLDVEAIGLNLPDTLVCAGRYQQSCDLPFSPGFEASGLVAEVGPGVDLRVGQRVIAVPELPNGSLQESLTLHANQVYSVENDVPAEVAAVVHIAYQTAHAALHRRAHLAEGETLLITGAAGGVGMAAVQLGRAAGARVVAVVTGESKARACREWGADVIVDLERGDLRTQLNEHDVDHADVVLDTVGAGIFDALRRAVGFEGRLVVVGFAGGEIPQLATNHVLLGNYSVLGVFLSRYRQADPSMLQRVHVEVLDLWRRGAVQPRIDRVLPFDEVIEGLALLTRRDVIGRVVLRVDR